MKFVFTFLVGALLCLIHLPSTAQNKSDTTVYYSAEKMPEYPGGMDALNKVIATKVTYPKQCADSGIQGKVYVRFVVNEDGSISNIEAIKGPHPLLNKAAVEAVKTLNGFIPGQQQGRAVKVYFNLPVAFKIGSGNKTSVFDFYPGGYIAFDTLVTNNMRYPAEARQQGLEAVITVVCKLNKQLKLTPERVENNIDTAFNNEAIRLVKLMGTFDDKIKQSDYVSSALFIKIHFDLPQPGGLKNYFAVRKANTHYYDMGVTYFKQNNFEKALEYFDGSIKYYPRDAEAYFNRAITKTKLKNEKGACDDFRRAYLLGLIDAREGVEQSCK